MVWCANKDLIIVPIITLPSPTLSLDTPTDTPTGTAQANSAPGSNNNFPVEVISTIYLLFGKISGEII